MLSIAFSNCSLVAPFRYSSTIFSLTSVCRANSCCWFIVKAPFYDFCGDENYTKKGAFRVNAQKLKAKNENSKPF